MVTQIQISRSLEWCRDRAWLPYFGMLLLGMLCWLPGSSYSEEGLNVGKISLPRGMSLLENDYMSSCVPLASAHGARSCVPWYLTLQAQGNLVLFRGGVLPESKAAAVDSDVSSLANARQVWESGRQKTAQVTRNDVLLVSSLFRFSVSGSDLRIYRGAEVVWSISDTEVMRNEVLAPVLAVMGKL